MAIVRYNPFRELRTMQEQMNRLLDLAWNREAGEELNEGVWQPPVDIYEDEDSVVIKAELPDIDQKDIEVRIEDNTLLLKGERKLDHSLEEGELPPGRAILRSIPAKFLASSHDRSGKGQRQTATAAS